MRGSQFAIFRLPRFAAELLLELKGMRETHHPASYDYRSLYSDLSIYREFEGGTVYVARGVGEWLVITDQSTLIDMLSEEDQIGERQSAIRILSFTSKDERDHYVSSRWHQKQYES